MIAKIFRVGNHNHNNDNDDGWLVGYLVTSTLLIDYVFDIYNQWHRSIDWPISIVMKSYRNMDKQSLVMVSRA